MKRLDKISSKNNEVFTKAYFKMLVVALPSVLALFNVSMSSGQKNSSEAVIEGGGYDDFL